MIYNLKIPIELFQDENGVVISTTEESENILCNPIMVSGKTFEEAEENFWYMLKSINKYCIERSEELNKYKWFQKGDWSQIGGTWFTLLGLHVYFRYGEGMIGGWYVPYTKLNISFTNYWLNKKQKDA